MPDIPNTAAPQTPLELLKTDLSKKAAEDEATNADNFIQDTELTEEDRAKLEQLQKENEEEVVVSETGEDGIAVRQPIREFAQDLDKHVTVVHDADGNETPLKTLMGGDIKKTTEQMQQEVKERALRAFREMAVVTNSGEDGEDEITDEKVLEINNAAIQALLDYLKVSKLEADATSKVLRKMSLAQISEILPKEFMHMYLTPTEVASNNYQARSRLLSVIEYLTVTGPEMDYLNEFIDKENKVALINQRIMEAQLKFAELLKDEEKLSEIVARVTEVRPLDDSFWAKYIRLPDRQHNVFAQRAVLFQDYKKAYEEIAADPQFEGCTEALEVINEQIEEAQMRVDIYTSLCDLELMKELYPIMENRFMNETKLTHKWLVQQAVSTVDRARRCKQNLPFPGYDDSISGKPDLMFQRYMVNYPMMIENYNKTIIQILQKEAQENPDTKTDVAPIMLEGYPEEMVRKVFSLVLLLLMGRILKKGTDHDATKYDAIILDGYFQLFCRLGTDIYCMSDVWNLCKPLVVHILENVKFDRHIKW